MKKIWLLSVIAVLFWSLALTGCINTDNKANDNNIVIEDVASNEEVIAYNDNLVDLATECFMSEDNVWTLYDDEESTIADIQSAIDSTLAVCNNAIESVKNLGDRKWDSSLKDGIITILGTDVAYFTNLKEEIPYLEIEELTEEQNAAYEAIVAKRVELSDAMDVASENLITIQAEFAKTHGYDLEE